MNNFVVAIAVLVVLGLLKSISLKSVNLESITELRLTKFYWYFGILSILIGFGIGLLIAMDEIIDTTSIIAISLLILFFSGTGFVLASYYKNHKVLVGKDQLTVVNLFNKSRTLKWEEIQKVSFNAISGYINFQGPNQKLKIHFHLVGISSLLKLVKDKTTGLSSQIEKIQRQLR